jgi:hypothetical protein
MSKLLAVLVAIFAAAWFAVPAFADPGPAGFVKICKDAGSPAVTGVFSFQISGTVENYVTPEVWVGQCTIPIRVTPTTDGKITVTEVGYTDPSDTNHFNTNDFTVVSAIHSTSWGDAPDAALSSVNLAARSAKVKITPSALDDESKVTIVHFVNDPVYGYYEICKHQITGAGLDNQIFKYTVIGALGYEQTVDVPVGSCSLPIYAPAGHVNIQEMGDAAYVTSITANGDNLLSSSIDDAWANVKVTPAAPGFDSGVSIVTFTNNSAQLEICKVVPDDGTLDTAAVYEFDVNGVKYHVNGAGIHTLGLPHELWGGWFDRDTVFGCILAGRYRAGTDIKVTETPKPGERVFRAPDGSVVGIQVRPADRNEDAVVSGTDFAGQAVSFTIASGDTTVYYLNVPADPQPLKICKLGAPADGSVAFTIAGPRYDEDGNLTTGSTTVNVPVGSCSDPVAYPFGGPQVITEAAGPYHLTGVTATTDAINGSRLGTVNLAGGSAPVWIGDGVTEVTFTNAAGGAAVVPPGSTPQPGTQTPAPDASIVAVAPPTKVVTPAAKKAVLKMASARIVKVGKFRYVVVRVNGAAKMARIHVTLVNKQHKVVSRLTRYVHTNKAVRVGNLRLKPAILSVKVSL